MRALVAGFLLAVLSAPAWAAEKAAPTPTPPPAQGETKKPDSKKDSKSEKSKADGVTSRAAREVENTRRTPEPRDPPARVRFP